MSAAVPTPDMEDLLLDCDVAALFLRLAVESALPDKTDMQNGRVLVQLTEDQFDAVHAAAGQVFDAIRRASHLFHGHYTIGAR